MRMPHSDPRPLRDRLYEVANAPRRLYAREGNIALSELARGSSLGGESLELHNRSVLIATRSQLTTALALIELDGVARRLVVLPPDMRREHLPLVVANAGVQAVVTDAETSDDGNFGVPLRVTCSPAIAPIPF